MKLRQTTNTQQNVSRGTCKVSENCANSAGIEFCDYTGRHHAAFFVPDTIAARR